MISYDYEMVSVTDLILNFILNHMNIKKHLNSFFRQITHNFF